MSWRLRVRHRTTLRYSGPVHASYNEVRISPRTRDGQLAITHEIETAPRSQLYAYTDAWQTLVHAFDVHETHDELVVAASSLVDSADPRSTEGGAAWSDLDGDTRDDYCEYLCDSSRVVSTDAIARAALEIRAGTTPDEAVDATTAWIHEAFTYEPGTTTVATTADEVLHAGHGVCQDFAHLGIALLRAIGIPARYVSGYLHPTPDAVIGQSYTGESHAWLEAWTGSWRAVDPTTAVAVGERHVIVGRGRDYGDVTPLKGIYHGAAADVVEVDVEIERVA
ncbi:MAG TPA: transglutaminase family protein [Acidimicrobiia bacterium]|nr:transglutaminase family protein [Acidimicrobiia bacterium]